MSNPWPTMDDDPNPDLSHLVFRTNRPHGWIYFIGSCDGELVKIGYSAKPGDRLLTHSGGDAFGRGGDYRILALVQGHKGDEKTLHRYFSDIRADGPKEEVFRAESRLLDYIIWLRDQYFVAIDINGTQSLRGELIPSDLWLPDDSKRKTKRRETDLFSHVPWSCLPERQQTADDWYTPTELMDLVREVCYGVIDLDPASHVFANKTVGAKEFFTKHENGLVRPWHGNVWLNPPFSEWPLWVPKITAEIHHENVTNLICLAFLRTLSAKYFEPILRQARAVAIFHGRRAFEGVQASDAAPDGVVMLCMKGDADRFERVMRKNATVFKAGTGVVDEEA